MDCAHILPDSKLSTMSAGARGGLDRASERRNEPDAMSDAMNCYKPLYDFKGAPSAPAELAMTLHGANWPPSQLVRGASSGPKGGLRSRDRLRAWAPAAFLSPGGHVGADAHCIPATD